MVAPKNVKSYYNYRPNSSQSFGSYRTPTRRHRGTDISHSSKSGTLVPALLGGVVTGHAYPSSYHGFGYQITIRSVFQGRTYLVSYAHGARAQGRAVGSSVSQGDYVSTEGTTGATSGPCSHIEVYDVAKGVYIDPMILIKAVLADQSAPSGNAGNPARPTAATKGIQNALNTLGYKLVVDGILGPKTLAAIKDFQRKRGLVADGIWGPKTNSAYNRISVSRRPIVKQGSRNSFVKIVQRKLGLTQDGIFGPKTKAAVVAFQRKHGLVSDGIVGSKTWAKLGY